MVEEAYQKVEEALDAAAQFEESKRDDPDITVFMPMSALLSCLCVIAIVLHEKEDRIVNDLRKDRRVASPTERKEIERLRVAYNHIVNAIKGTTP